jgi:hypothetical protein
LTQTASDSDRLAAEWVNAVRNKLSNLEQQLAIASEQINSLKSQISQAFRVTQLTGLTAQYASGSVKLPSGIVVAISSGTVTVGASATTYLWISDTGAVQLTTTRPTIGLEIARITSSATTITEIQNYPIFEVRPAFPSLDGYSTIDYANSRAWLLTGTARKTTLQGLPSRDTYYTLFWQSISDGTNWNTGGIYTAPTTGKYVFHAQVRVDTTATASNPELAVKLSLFVGNVEIDTPLMQAMSAFGDISLNSSNAAPVQLNAGDTATIKAYVTNGTSVRVREGSVCTAWRLPS